MKINPSVVCELVGDDVVVLDSGNSAVVTLTGDSAGVVKRLLAGETVSHTEPGADELVAQGIIVSTSPNGLSRRSLVTTGAAVGAGGIFAMTLPSAANSSSPAGVTDPEVTEPEEPEELQAPQFTEDTEGWTESQWLDFTMWDGDGAYILVSLIEDFDETLIYEFRLPSETTFYTLTYSPDDNDPEFDKLEFSWPDGQPAGFAGLTSALLRVRNADGLVSDETEFFFAPD